MYAYLRGSRRSHLLHALLVEFSKPNAHAGRVLQKLLATLGNALRKKNKIKVSVHSHENKGCNKGDKQAWMQGRAYKRGHTLSSSFSSVFLRKLCTQVEKHFSTRLLYMRKLEKSKTRRKERGSTTTSARRSTTNVKDKGRRRRWMNVATSWTLTCHGSACSRSLLAFASGHPRGGPASERDP